MERCFTNNIYGFVVLFKYYNIIRTFLIMVAKLIMSTLVKKFRKNKNYNKY